jgi:hypothetical protein
LPWLDENQRSSISASITLVGLELLFLTGWWWPGIMLVIAVVILAEGAMRGELRCGLQGAGWLLAIAVWSIFNYNVGLLFVVIGVGVLANAFLKPGVARKPHVDNTLD